MSATLVRELEDQIQKFWSPIFVPELKESAVLPSLVDSSYDGEIKQGGDTVYVSMIENAVGGRKTIDGSGAHTVIGTEKLRTQRVGIVADQIFEASFELDNLIDLQTQLGDPSGQSGIRAALMSGIEKQLNDYLYSLCSPSTATPDHVINGVTDFNYAALLANRALASKAYWPGQGVDWYTLLNPDYYNDFLTDTKNTSSDYVGADLPIVGGQRVHRRAGFNILEDNSAGINQLSPTLLGSDVGLSFHKSFMYLVMQKQASFKLSDLHANKTRGYLLTCELIGGAKLGIQGALKHIKVYNT